MKFLIAGSLLLVAFHCDLNAGSLRPVWDLDFAKLMREGAQSIDFPVFAIRFSPNGRNIAVIVHFYELQRPHDRLLIVHAEHPESEFRELEIPTGVLDDERGYVSIDLGWSASGDSLVLLGKRIPVEGQLSCLLTGLEGESAWSHIESNPWQPARWTARVLVLDAACEPGLKVDFPPEWEIQDISPDRRLLCVRAGSDILIVDPVNGTTMRKWPRSVVPGQVKFAENGKTLCQGTMVDRSGRVPLSCWDIASGRKIGEAETIHGGMPFAASAMSSRVVASDYFYIWNPFMDSSSGGIFKRRVVWDFRSGEEVVSWHPDEQTYTNTTVVPPRKTKERFNFSISPDGRFVAEGGNGTLRLYRIEP